MKKEGMLLIVLIVILTIPCILALDTKVNVKTVSGRLVTIRFMDELGRGTLEGGSFIDVPADEEGTASATFSSDTENYVKLAVMLRDSSGALVNLGKSQPLLFNEEKIKTGWIYEIDLNTDDAMPVKLEKSESSSEEPAEETEENSTEPLEEEIPEEPETKEIAESEEIEQEENQAPTTGAVIGSLPNIPKTAIYIVIGIVALSALFFLFLHLKSKPKSPENFKVTKYSEKIASAKSSGEIQDRIDEKDDDLKDVEERLKNAEEEIKQIKEKRRRIREAQQKLERDKRELESLEEDH
jgi:hypothetical protein